MRAHLVVLTLAFWQTGSGMHESRVLEERGLQPPRQNCNEPISSQIRFMKSDTQRENSRCLYRRIRIRLQSSIINKVLKTSRKRCFVCWCGLVNAATLNRSQPIGIQVWKRVVSQSVNKDRNKYCVVQLAAAVPESIPTHEPSSTKKLTYCSMARMMGKEM